MFIEENCFWFTARNGYYRYPERRRKIEWRKVGRATEALRNTQLGGDTGFTIRGKHAAEVMRRWCAEGGDR